jgi:transcriptional regulator with GAF, ATPase, and Fis domain
MPDEHDPATLEEARETIANQQREIERLRGRVEDDRFAEDLRDVLVLAAASGTIASPVKHERLLEMIVRAAAHVIKARAGSIFTIDETKGELVFETAIGPKAEAVSKFRVPIGQGIAGLVAATGQAMAISNAQDDERLLEGIGDRIGYEPQTLLCVPLFLEDRSIGVIELLDKIDATSFTPADMETLGMFAAQAAIAVEMSRTYRHLGPLVNEVLASLGDSVPEERKRSLQERSGAFAQHIEEEPTFRETMELADIVQDIAWAGEAELQACRAVLQAFKDFLEARRGTFEAVASS